MVIYLSLLVSLVGLLMYALAANPKVTTIGLHMFWVGLLAFLLGGAPHIPTIVG
jgi:hypothetical protein